MTRRLAAAAALALLAAFLAHPLEAQTVTLKSVVSWSDPANRKVTVIATQRIGDAANPLQTDTIANASSPTTAFFTWSTIAPGQMVTVTRTARICIGSTCSATATRTDSYTNPSLPTPTIDTLALRPKAVNLAMGQGVQFCAFPIFSDGNVANRAIGGAACDSLYRASFSQRSPTLAEQIVADGVCVEWRATGGTILNEACAPGTPEELRYRAVVRRTPLLSGENVTLALLR